MNPFIIVRKVIQSVVLVLFVVVILYVLLRLMPGNPAELYIHSLRHPTPTAIHAIYKEYGINPNNKFSLTEFIIYFKDMFTFHFGVSLSNLNDPVISLIDAALPYTLIIFGVAAVGSFIIGIPLGILTAFIRGKKSEAPIITGATILNSIPFFAMAIVVYLVLVVYLPYFPTTVAHFRLAPLLSHPTLGEFEKMVHYFAMPILTIMVIEVMGHLLTMRSIMVSTLGEDYIKTAEAKGVSNSGIMLHHAARNAMVPESTRMALEFAFLMSGAVVTEIIFGVPGMGRLLYTNTLDENYTVIEAGLFILSLVVIITYSIIDFIHAWLDPRVKV
ncbi:ABC transporter permease [Ferroplasma sp.]|uniref:ABC transporter permease n=1 Tax=Ferroplasma sp. TaxID=2591003 RepID=UPI00307FC854